jgi:hypothetical protein
VSGHCRVPSSELLLQPVRLHSLVSHIACSSGREIPGGLAPSDTPQMIILTFDDAITDRSINIYKSLFDGKFRNPNGCPIKATFFVNHEWNNYDQTQWLHSNFHEIAVNSITFVLQTEKWRHLQTSDAIIENSRSMVGRDGRNARCPERVQLC